MNSLIDIGANLTHSSFESDRSDVIDAARAAGVNQFVLTGTSVEDSQLALLTAQSMTGAYATAGVHPHHASDFSSQSVEQIRVLAQESKVVAIGECGLDYFRNFSDPAAQRDAFFRQLQLAVEVKLPVFLHQRDAHADFLAIVREFRHELVGGVAHCFTGDRAQLDTFIELDLFVGITGWICDERRGQELRDAVVGLPRDRVMVETDAPYLLPRDLDPKPASRRNEPKYLPHIVNRLSLHMDIDAETLAKHTTENAQKLFALTSI